MRKGEVLQKLESYRVTLKQIRADIRQIKSPKPKQTIKPV